MSTRTRTTSNTKSYPKRARIVLKPKSRRRFKPNPNPYAIVRSPAYPYPKVYETQMRYDSVFYLSLVSGTYTTYKLSCNGMYDPDITGVGTQPLYFSSLSGVYDHYTVLSSYISVEPSSLNVDTSTVIALFKDDDTTVPLSITGAIGRPGCVSSFTNLQIAKPPVMYQKWSAASEFGNMTPWTDPEMQGTSTSNPSEQTYYIIAAEDFQAKSFSLYCKICIRYTVRWDELKTVVV